MGDEDLGQSHLTLQLAQQVQDLRLNGDVQSGNRLVADDELGVHRQSAGDADTLAAAAVKLMRIGVDQTLVDTDGLVVGLNARGNLWGDQAFTIPSETILEILPDLRKYGEAHWAWFGFKLQPLEDFKRNIRFDAKEGALVADVEPGSPAEKAGLKSNDLLVSVDGEKVTARFWEDIPAIERRLGRKEFEKTCAFKVVRDGSDVEIAIAPTEKGKVEGEEFACGRWGLTAKEINRFYNPDLIFFAPEGGVYVSGLAWDGNADSCGFRDGDIIVSIGGKPVKTVAEVKAVYEDSIAKLEERTRLPFVVMRRGRRTTLVLDYTEDTEEED